MFKLLYCGGLYLRPENYGISRIENPYELRVKEENNAWVMDDEVRGR